MFIHSSERRVKKKCKLSGNRDLMAKLEDFESELPGKPPALLQFFLPGNGSC